MKTKERKLKKKIRTALQRNAQKGGKARWHGISKEARSAEMSRVAKGGKLSTGELARSTE